ncbi:hypothetical protein KRMM14A1004_58940 [Krasilnikovia sp. MM14-A1004]
MLTRATGWPLLSRGTETEQPTPGKRTIEISDEAYDGLTRTATGRKAHHTLDTYGPVHSIHQGRPCARRRGHTPGRPAAGHPVDPNTYDYWRAAWDERCTSPACSTGSSRTCVAPSAVTSSTPAASNPNPASPRTPTAQGPGAPEDLPRHRRPPLLVSRLLRAALADAVIDELLATNPATSLRISHGYRPKFTPMDRLRIRIRWRCRVRCGAPVNGRRVHRSL